jgi:hypothetical protein
MSYRDNVEASGLYRIVFQEGRVRLYVKKDKIAQLLKMDIAQIDEFGDDELRTRWSALPTPIPRNIFGMKVLFDN